MPFSTYFVSDYFMKQMSHSYDAIPDDKKFYVLSNLIKSAVLLAYCPSCVYTLYRAMAIDDWSTPRIRNMGVLYAIPDAVSLLLVSRMAWSTKVHWPLTLQSPTPTPRLAVTPHQPSPPQS